MTEPEKRFLSHRDYLEMEAETPWKNEYYHGEVFAMTGASFRHNVIAGNVFAALHGALGRSDCYVFTGDMKVQVEKDRHYVYPDVSVVCGEIEFAEERTDTVSNPLVIVEVLSESTQDYDRGSKFRAYRGIETLRDYVLIDQYTPHIEHFSKNDAGKWVLDELDGENATLEIGSIGVVLSLSSVYRRAGLRDSP